MRDFRLQAGCQKTPAISNRLSLLAQVHETRYATFSALAQELPFWTQAFVECSRALLELDRLEEAEVFLRDALTVHAGSRPLESLLAQVLARRGAPLGE